MDVPDGGVGRMRVIRDGGIEIVVVALGGVHRLGTTDLLSWLTEDFERALYAVPLPGRPGTEKADQCCCPQGRVWVGMASGPAMQPGARGAIRHWLLGVLWHGVILGIGGQYRPSFAP